MIVSKLLFFLEFPFLNPEFHRFFLCAYLVIFTLLAKNKPQRTGGINHTLIQSKWTRSVQLFYIFASHLCRINTKCRSYITRRQKAILVTRKKAVERWTKSFTVLTHRKRQKSRKSLIARPRYVYSNTLCFCALNSLKAKVLKTSVFLL